MPATMIAPAPARAGEQISSLRRRYSFGVAHGPWLLERCQLCDERLQDGGRIVYGPAYGPFAEEVYDRACWRRAYHGEDGA